MPPKNETEAIAARRSPSPATPAAADRAGADPLALEALAHNLEASLRVYTNHHFFSWTQGLLQNLIRHEVLICSLRKGAGELSLVDSYSTAHTDPKQLSQLYRQDAAMAEKLSKAWEANAFRPLLCDAATDALFADSVLARELKAIGATRIVAHGTHDTGARMASFFVFACRDDDPSNGPERGVEMLVPFLHAAWVRTKIGLPGKAAGGNAAAGNRNLLTQREQEVLRWVYLGKSNIEIGIILGISPLTVKNHVQEILRRLNVQNRTQAVGKAFNMHILTV